MSNRQQNINQSEQTDLTSNKTMPPTKHVRGGRRRQTDQHQQPDSSTSQPPQHGAGHAEDEVSSEGEEDVLSEEEVCAIPTRVLDPTGATGK
jgi:hypothetical protein